MSTDDPCAFLVLFSLSKSMLVSSTLTTTTGPSEGLSSSFGPLLAYTSSIGDTLRASWKPSSPSKLGFFVLSYCWLETALDKIFYLFVLGQLTGLVRQRVQYFFRRLRKACDRSTGVIHNKRYLRTQALECRTMACIQRRDYCNSGLDGLFVVEPSSLLFCLCFMHAVVALRVWLFAHGHELIIYSLSSFFCA